MFGSSKSIPFNPYGRRRKRFGLPRWLVLLLVGIALGAGGVIVVQERYLPPRLSASASTELQAAFERTDTERLRLAQQHVDATQRLDATLGDKKGLADELAANRATIERLQDDVASVVMSLPPDPRGGVVEVRSGRFSAKGNALAYDVVLTRERAAGKPMAGVMQLVVAGDSAKGSDTALTLKPVAVAVGSHEIVRGSVPLPDGFRPRKVTVQVLDRAGGRSLGMRVLLAK